MKKFIVLMGLALTIGGFHNIFPAKPASNQVIVDWLTLQQQLIRNTKKVSHVAYARHFSYTSVALYEAVYASETHYQTLAGQLQGLKKLPAAPPKGATCWSASANAAMAEMFRHFYGQYANNKDLIDSLENKYWSALSAQYSKRQLHTGKTFGAAVAKAVIDWSKEDGTQITHPTYQIPEGEGLWIKSPPAFANPAEPYWSKNRTMVPHDPAHLLVPPTFKYGSTPKSDFYAIVKDLYDVSQNLTDAEKEMALFWDDSPNGKYLSVYGHWASIFLQVLTDQSLSLVPSAEAFAKMSLSQHDAAILCWHGKYSYNVMRPVSFIHQHLDQNWTPLIETPPHPEYPAAHATLSAAAATALEAVFGKNRTFIDHSYEGVGLPARTFSSFQAAGKEAGLSRLYGGIHYRPSIEAGYDLGSKTAQEVLATVKFQKRKSPLP